MPGRRPVQTPFAPWRSTSARAHAIFAGGITSFSAKGSPKGRVASMPELGGHAALVGARVEHGAETPRDDDEVAVGLHPRGHRPQHVGLVEDVDVVVHHDHQLQVVVHAEHDGDDVLGLAGATLPDGHVGGEGGGARERHVHAR